MPGQPRVPKPAPAKQADVDSTPTKAGVGDALKDDLDGLLDEIDEVLEHNAEDFVKAYIQKGGQ